MSARYLEQLKKSKAAIGDTKAAKSNEIKLPLPEDIPLSTEDYDLPIEASVKMAALTEGKFLFVLINSHVCLSNRSEQ